MSSLAQKLSVVKARIATAIEKTDKTLHSVQTVRLLAVSKTKPKEDVFELYQSGQRAFGENYLQEALKKINALSELDIIWHFIGFIQSNKTRAIAENFDWVQTIDRTKIAQRLSDQRPAGLMPLNCCIQVNMDAQETKSGVFPNDIMPLAEQISKLGKLTLRGLMFIPKPQQTPAAQLQSCQAAAVLFERLKQTYPQCDTLSLGMSGDLEQAIIAGSNMVRIGSDLFGKRAVYHNEALINSSACC